MCGLICESSASRRYVLFAVALAEVGGGALVAPGVLITCVRVNLLSLALDPDVPVAPLVPDGAIARSRHPVIVTLLSDDELGRCAGEV